MNPLLALARWFGLGGSLNERTGQQLVAPSSMIVEETMSAGVDQALQVSTVYRCVDLLAKTIATLPLFVYERDRSGKRELARDTLLWGILHDSPNNRMTIAEFLMAMMVNFVLRGNAYARVERNAAGRAVQLWPMAADQVTPYVLEDGSLVYLYQVDGDTYALDASQVLHIKDLGNGTVGLSRLDYMRPTMTEVARGQAQATRTFANGNKPSGVLMIDRVLNDEQRRMLRTSFGEVAQGSASRLYILEAGAKYEAISMTPEQVQLLETRRFGVEEVCRWFGVPPVLVGHSNVTTWGSGVEQILDGFHKLTVRPLLVLIEQAMTKRLLTPAERSRYTIEFSYDALLRASLKDRMEIYAKAVQNGLKTRNECRQLENDPPMAGGDDLTAQINLTPIGMLGKAATQGAANASQNTVAQ